MRVLPSIQIGVYFTEVNAGPSAKYVPRSIQIDLESGVLDKVRSVIWTHIDTHRITVVHMQFRSNLVPRVLCIGQTR